jgi:hypothetical protein
MPLREDDRALLQLVCERGQSYADLGELLGISEEQVRQKARGALRELGGSDPDAEVGLTDYLLGQADPIGRADAVRHLQQDPDARELAEAIVAKLRLLAPAAELPKLPDAKGKRRKAATPSPAEDDSARGPALAAAGGTSSEPSGSHRQARLIAGVLAGGLLVVFAVLAIAGVFSGESESGAGGDALAAADQELTPVALSAQGGSGVAGTAEFGLTDDQLFIDLNLDGLDPSLGRSSVYVLWLMVSQQDGGYPVSIIAPDQNGGVEQRYTIPTEVAVAIATSARFVQVGESPAAGLQGNIDRAVEAASPLVDFRGKVLSRGRIPLTAGDTAPAIAGGNGGGGGQGGGNGGGNSGANQP